jgi:hypothetical protein
MYSCIRYPAWKSHVPYYDICCLSGSNILFTHYFINGTIFEKKKMNIIYLFWLYLYRLSETFLILRINPDMNTNIRVYQYSCKVPLLLSDFKETWIFGKNTNTEFHENSSSGSRVGPCKRTDRQTDMTKLVVARRNFLKTPKNWNAICLEIPTALRVSRETLFLSYWM